MRERLRIIRQALYTSSLAQNRQPEAGESAVALAISFAYALDEVPTQHLEKAFRRAMLHKRDTFPLTAGEVNAEYQDMLPELQAMAKTVAEEQERRLIAGHGSLGLMSLAEFKARHNLPEEWQLGQPYPPESDLHGVLQLSAEEVEQLSAEEVEQYSAYTCTECKGARWVVDRAVPGHPKLLPCPRCGTGMAGADE